MWCHPEGRLEGWKSGRGNAEKGHRRQMLDSHGCPASVSNPDQTTETATSRSAANAPAETTLAKTGRLQVFRRRGLIRIFEARPLVCRFIFPDGGGDRKERRNRTGGKTNVISSHHMPASFTRRNSTRKESRCSDGLHDPEGSVGYVDIHMEIFPGIRIVDSSGSQSRFRCIDDGLFPEPDVVRIRRQTLHYEIDRLAGSVRTDALVVRAHAFREAFHRPKFPGILGVEIRTTD